MLEVIDELKYGGAVRYEEYADQLENSLIKKFGKKEVALAQSELEETFMTTIDMDIINEYIEKAKQYDLNKKALAELDVKEVK